MPLQPSRLIVSSLDGLKEQAMIRSYRIPAHEEAVTP